MDCGPLVHDAGVVAQGRILSSDVVCRNTTERTVDLHELVTGCPCLAISPSTPGEIAPGASVHLRLTLSTDGLTDRVGFPVETVLHAGSQPVALFHYEADVRPSVIAYPEYIDLGDWKRGGEKTFLLVDTTGASFGIEKASSSRNTVEVRWVQVGLLRVNGHWTIASGKAAVSGYQVTLQPHAAGKDGRRSLSDEVVLDLRHAVQRTVRVRVMGFSQ